MPSGQLPLDHEAPAGVILGTGASTSPEQARGRAVDKRADLWALGAILWDAILWEMLTGERLFGGETVNDTVANILCSDPDRAKLPAELPPDALRVIKRCLERDPRRR